MTHYKLLYAIMQATLLPDTCHFRSKVDTNAVSKGTFFTIVYFDSVSTQTAIASAAENVLVGL